MSCYIDARTYDPFKYVSEMRGYRGQAPDARIQHILQRLLQLNNTGSSFCETAEPLSDLRSRLKLIEQNVVTIQDPFQRGLQYLHLIHEYGFLNDFTENDEVKVEKELIPLVKNLFIEEIYREDALTLLKGKITDLEELALFCLEMKEDSLDVEEWMELLPELENHEYLYCRVVLKIVEFHSNQDDEDSVARFLREATEVAETILDKNQRIEMLMKIGNVYWENGLWEHVVKCFEKVFKCIRQEKYNFKTARMVLSMANDLTSCCLQDLETPTAEKVTKLYDEIKPVLFEAAKIAKREIRLTP
jgi:hypothetical protein